MTRGAASGGGWRQRVEEKRDEIQRCKERIGKEEWEPSETDRVYALYLFVGRGKRKMTGGMDKAPLLEEWLRRVVL